MNRVYLAISTVVAVVAFVAGYLLGTSHVQARWDAQTLARTQEDHQVLLLGMKDSYEAGVAHEEAREEIRYVVDTIIKQVPVYIKDTSICPVLPDGWGLLHNTAAQAANAVAASGQLDDQSATSLHRLGRSQGHSAGVN